MAPRIGRLFAAILLVAMLAALAGSMVGDFELLLENIDTNDGEELAIQTTIMATFAVGAVVIAYVAGEAVSRS